MEPQIYQIHIYIKSSNPKIWRRILVPSNLSLSDFHKIIQKLMGWSDTHLHEFVLNKVHYSVANDFDDDSFIDYRKKKIKYQVC